MVMQGMMQKYTPHLCICIKRNRGEGMRVKGRGVGK
jgi:hypothetical protein